jgi:hypothetical protein
MNPTKETAKEFFIALRNVGLTLNEQGVKIRNLSLLHHHEVAAIEKFCGYDLREPHGSQLDAARRLATSLLKPVVVPSTEYSRGSSAPVSSIVPGLPDRTSKEKGILESRIRELVELKCASFKHGENVSNVDQQLKSLRNRLAMLAL